MNVSKIHQSVFHIYLHYSLCPHQLSPAIHPMFHPALTSSATTTTSIRPSIITAIRDIYYAAKPPIDAATPANGLVMHRSASTSIVELCNRFRTAPSSTCRIKRMLDRKPYIRVPIRIHWPELRDECAKRRDLGARRHHGARRLGVVSRYWLSIVFCR